MQTIVIVNFVLLYVKDDIWGIYFSFYRTFGRENEIFKSTIDKIHRWYWWDADWDNPFKTQIGIN